MKEKKNGNHDRNGRKGIKGGADLLFPALCYLFHIYRRNYYNRVRNIPENDRWYKDTHSGHLIKVFF
jgi:hypothetical protein